MENADVWKTITNFKNKQLIMRVIILSLLITLFGCKEHGSKRQGTNAKPTEEIKSELLSLERKWLDAEFALDTAYISTPIDPSFIDISENIHNKQQALKGMYDGMNARRRDSIVFDSLKFEDVVVNLYENTAVIALITHSWSHKKDGKQFEKRMRFYDVWINRNGSWKAVASQGTMINGNL